MEKKKEIPHGALLPSLLTPMQRAALARLVQTAVGRRRRLFASSSSSIPILAPSLAVHFRRGPFLLALPLFLPASFPARAKGEERGEKRRNFEELTPPAHR